jgi:hypothetical protein
MVTESCAAQMLTVSIEQTAKYPNFFIVTFSFEIILSS